MFSVCFHNEPHSYFILFLFLFRFGTVVVAAGDTTIKSLTVALLPHVLTSFRLELNAGPIVCDVALIVSFDSDDNVSHSNSKWKFHQLFSNVIGKHDLMSDC